ncbi:MAG: hypothetical protein KKA54_14170 [Proteobacteria bacterium]|nr:hypothetical protein [Pseudomonadota bacterium]MBU0967515.1 hypothetical protein [Pseudomonadota bacterium]
MLVNKPIFLDIYHDNFFWQNTAKRCPSKGYEKGKRKAEQQRRAGGLKRGAED